MGKTTLCDSCDIEVFKRCPFVHFRGRVDGMKTVPVRSSYKYRGKRVWIYMERVDKCPDYIPEKVKEKKK